MRGFSSTERRTTESFLPASMRETSRRSSTNRLRRSDSSLMTADHSRALAGSASPRAMSSEKARMLVIGVRSSWLTVLRKAVFMRSSSLKRVMSRRTTTKPVR